MLAVGNDDRVLYKQGIFYIIVGTTGEYGVGEKLVSASSEQPFPYSKTQLPSPFNPVKVFASDAHHFLNRAGVEFHLSLQIVLQLQERCTATLDGHMHPQVSKSGCRDVARHWNDFICKYKEQRGNTKGFSFGVAPTIAQDILVHLFVVVASLPVGMRYTEGIQLSGDVIAREDGGIIDVAERDSPITIETTGVKNVMERDPVAAPAPLLSKDVGIKGRFCRKNCL
ncbi:hypothetical protein V8B97DRAFT_2077172 [Scleroderma yunnanense]